MARKKVEPIISLGSNGDKLLVQKSLPLFALWRSDLTLAEFKILDTYLSRINSHNPEKRAVIFDKGELEDILGVKKINSPDLKERLKHLMGSVVEIPDEDVKKGFRLITLFDEAVAELDDYGLWQVKLECSQKAMKYIFNIENLGYLRYKLRCITSITSRYTYIMFIYLESNRYKKSWEVPLDELKSILNCDKEDYTKEFKRFNDRILKRIQKEMLEKTECRYAYTPIKRGRSVVAVRFTLETLPKINLKDVDPSQYTLEDYIRETDQPGRQSEIWETAVEEFNFSPEEILELSSLLYSVPPCAFPPNGAIPGDTDMDKHHYVLLKVLEIKRRDTKQPIKNKFAYLKKMIEKDVEEWKS